MNRMLQLGEIAGRTFVIGDIHGKYDSLMSGLEQIKFDYSKDRLIAVGDLVDRGDQNMQCLDLIKKSWFYTVIGNHEFMMASGLNGNTQDMNMWLYNGGAWYYDLDDASLWALKSVHVPYILDDMPVGIEFTENGLIVGVTHAGLPSGCTWWTIKLFLKDMPKLDTATFQSLIWTRTRAQRGPDNEILGLDLLINGHTPSKEHVWRGNNVFIDTGYYKPLVPINITDLLRKNNER